VARRGSRVTACPNRLRNRRRSATGEFYATGGQTQTRDGDGPRLPHKILQRGQRFGDVVV
jgi:hypothetical protein